MKKIWAMRKDAEGVSPVIATILMVAITVVLAAVLYVMVLGIGGPGASVPTIGSTPSTTATTYVWTVVQTTGTIQQSDVYVQLKANGTSTFIIATELLSTASGTHGFVYSAASTGTTVGAGDVFTLSKALYGQGTTLTLVTASATGTYVAWTI